MSKGNYIKLHRDVMDHVVFSDPILYKLFSYCLLKASWKERECVLENDVVELIPGQFIWGRKSATEDLNHKAPPKYKLSEKTWENKLKVLEKLNIVTRKTTNKFTVVTVVNWGVYQGNEHEDYQQNDQQATNRLPTDYQQITTNKKVKESIRKEKNVVVQGNDNDFKEVVLSYQENIEMNPSPITYNKILQDSEQYGSEVMKYAIELSALKNNHNYTFINFLLQDWYKRGLKDVEAIKQYENKRIVNGSNKNNNGYQSKYRDAEFKAPADFNDLPF